MTFGVQPAFLEKQIHLGTLTSLKFASFGTTLVYKINWLHARSCIVRKAHWRKGGRSCVVGSSTQRTEGILSLPATELNGQSGGEFGELKHVRETEFVGYVNAATEMVLPLAMKKEEEVQLTHWWSEYSGSSWRTRSRW